MAEQNGARDLDGFPDKLPAPIFPWEGDETSKDADLSELLEAFTAEYVDFTLTLAAYLGARLERYGLPPNTLGSDFLVAAAAMTPDLIDRQREMAEQLEEMRENERRRR